MELTFDLRDFLEKTKMSILAPRELYKAVAKEKNWKTTLSYSIAISVVASIFGVIQSVLLYPYIKNLLPTELQNLKAPTLVEALPAFLLFTIFMVLLSFVWSWFIHNWLKLFKVKGEYWEGYKAYVYSTAVSSLLGWIPVVGYIAAAYSLYVLVIGLSKLYDITPKKAALLMLPLVVLRLVVGYFFI